MHSDPLICQLALTMIPKIGAITARKLIAYLGSAEAVFMEKSSTLAKIPGIGPFLAKSISLKPYLSEAEKELSEMKQNNISYVYYRDPEYPWRLKNCEDGPLFLYYKGRPDFARPKILSVVGTRSASNYGKEACRNILSTLSAKYPDLVVVSGLAYGIDIAAHRAALEFGLDTFAILAHGLTTIYPSSHRNTAFRIEKQGALLSDFHSNVLPERNNFLRRNRIIAGISEATLVIESGRKGGALITADIASSYNREVFALPGRAGDIYSAGCNYLLKNNIAALVETGEDIESYLGWESSQPGRKASLVIKEALTSDEKRILKSIAEEPGIGQEILSLRAEIPISKLMGILLQMELKNWVTLMPGNVYETSAHFVDTWQH